jgi:tetratricopeptide (TPR) repeat protein
MKDGDFLAALEHSRALYATGHAGTPDVAAHCGLVFAISSFGEARACTAELLRRVAQQESTLEQDLERRHAELVREQAESRLLIPELQLYDPKAFHNGRLVPGWRQMRFGVEAQLVLDDLKWRTLYLRGLVALQTGDLEAARSQLLQAHAIVHAAHPIEDGAESLLDLLEGRQRWHHQRAVQRNSGDSRAWWMDLLSALAIADIRSGDPASAQACIDELKAALAPRMLDGYKQSRLAFAYLATGQLQQAQEAIDADPAQTRETLRTGGLVLGGSLLVLTGVVVASLLAAPAGVAAAIANAAAAAATLIVGVSASVLTITASRIAGSDTAWDVTQRWYAAAVILRRNGHPEKSDVLYARLLQHEALLRSQPSIQWQVYADVAERHEEAGRAEQAIAFYEKAIDVIEATRRNIATESARIGFVADKQRVYERLIRLRLQRGDTDKAFELSEQARARALLDLLAQRDAQAPEEPGQQPASRIEVQESESRLALLLDRPAEAERRRAVVAQQREQLQEQDPELASQVSVPRYRLADIRAQLLPGEVLVSFIPLEQRIVAIAVSREQLADWEMPAGEITARVGMLRHAIEQRSVTPALLRGLASALFAGLPGMGPFELVSIVPTGALHALPFAALQTADGPLPTSAALRVLPSASVLPLLAGRARAPVRPQLTALGNPDFGGTLPALPSTEAEARSVSAIFGPARLLLGREASKAHLLQSAVDSSALHVATHGRFDAERPLQSALYLSDGRGGTAALTASELYGLRFGVRLVTLSACETALGAVRSGDEVIGLYRAWMSAGADTIVASLWEVDDESTAFLMGRFYEHLKNSAAPQALQRAQTDTAARWPEPYHWAGFAVIGLDRPFGASFSPAPSASAPAR